MFKMLKEDQALNSRVDTLWIFVLA
jgi:hypothetical protein